MDEGRGDLGFRRHVVNVVSVRWLLAVGLTDHTALPAYVTKGEVDELLKSGVDSIKAGISNPYTACIWRQITLENTDRSNRNHPENEATPPRISLYRTVAIAV